MQQVSHLIEKNKSLQYKVGTLIERENAMEKILNTIEKHLEVLSTRSFADHMPDLSSICASSEAEDSIKIDDALKSAATVAGSCSIK